MASNKNKVIENGAAAGAASSAVKGKKLTLLDNVMIVVALLAAIALWTYVYTTTNTVSEKTFNLVSIEKRNSDSLFDDYNLVVQNMNTDTMSVTVMGSHDAVNKLDISDIKAYVNLAGITEAGEYRLEVVLDLPEGISDVNQSKSHVDVLVDKSTVKNFNLTDQSVILGSHNVESGYEITSVSTNVTSVKLEGSSGDLAKVDSVGVLTGALGTVRNSMTASSEITLLDSAGNALSLPGVHVTANVANAETYITVLKEKKIALTVNTTYGYFDPAYITLSPSEIVVKGDPEAVDSLGSLVLGEINEKQISYPLYETELEIPGLEGLQVTDGEGNAVSSVKVKVDISSLPSRTVTNVPLVISEELTEYIDVVLVARDDGTDCREMLSAISADNIGIYLQDGMTRYAIDIASPFDDYLFECGNFVTSQEGAE